MIKISVQTELFDLNLEQKNLCAHSTNIGAVVAFTGLCRSENGSLQALELEHYQGMAETQLRTTAELAVERWNLSGVTLIHRVGIIPVGEEIVLVLAASAHRKEAFQAADFMMDYLKSTAPFWKKEHRQDGSRGEWVEAKTSDSVSLENWNKSSN